MNPFELIAHILDTNLRDRWWTIGWYSKERIQLGTNQKVGIVTEGERETREGGGRRERRTQKDESGAEFTQHTSRHLHITRNNARV